MALDCDLQDVSLDSTTVKVHQDAGSKNITFAPQLICDLKSATVIVDVGYDSLKFREQIRAKGSTACIKPRRNRKDNIPFDKEQYKERHLVECFFQKLKRYRRIATCYDKLAKRFPAFIHFACILIWLL